MKILIKENESFGGYIGYLCNDDLSIYHIPTPINTNVMKYTNKDKEKIINYCKKEAKVLFDINIDIEIVDLTEIEEVWQTE